MAAADTQGVIAVAVAPRRASLPIARKVAQMTSLAQMQELLQPISRLRPDLQTGLLSQAMLRLHALPQDQRQEALTAIRYAVNGLAAHNRPCEPPGLALILKYPDAIAAVSQGEDASVVAPAFSVNLRHGLAILNAHQRKEGARETTVMRTVRSLEKETINSRYLDTAGAALLDGANLREIAAQYCITTPFGRRSAEQLTINSLRPHTAGAAMRAGGNVQQVAAHFTITEEQSIREMEEITIRSDAPNSAGGEMLAGGHVAVVAAKYGVQSEAGMRGLKAITIKHDAPKTVLSAHRDGVSSVEIYTRYGITQQDFIDWYSGSDSELGPIPDFDHESEAHSGLDSLQDSELEYVSDAESDHSF